jgi:two-component system sensor histidine kinase YesM
MEGDEKVIEIEDTGCGMDEQAIKDILDKMENADIDRLKSGERVGIINASLRLKMRNPDRIRFFIESEEDEGTIIQIFIK